MLSERLLRLLTAYVDGEVSAHQRKIVLRHLQRSAEARALLKNLQDDANQLRHLPPQALGVDLSHKILERIGDPVVLPIRVTVPELPSPIPRGFGLAIAAAVLLAMGFGSFYYLKAITEKGPQVVQGPSMSGTSVAVNTTDKEPRIEGTPSTKADDRPSTSPVAASEKIEKLAQMPKPVVLPKEPVEPTPEKPIYAVPATLPDHFKVVEYKVAMNVQSRDLLLEKPRLDLLTRLQSEPAQHIDLYCKQTQAGLQRLEAAFKAQGIRSVIAPDAVDPYLFGKTKTDYVLYTENVTSGEVLNILHQLAREDRKNEASRKAPWQFAYLLVNSITTDDQKLLSKVLGVDPTQLQVSRPKTPFNVDIRRPIAAKTEVEVINNLKGQGGVPRPEPGKAAVKTPERLVVVGTCNPVHPRPESAEIKRFLDSRKERGSGTLQVLLVLRHDK